MPDMITRCPNCATAFRISDTLLTSAKGRVRCGSCLQVFNARDHLQPTPKPLQHQRPSAPASAGANSVPMSITGFLKRQDGSQEAEAAAAPWRAAQPPEHPQHGLFERTSSAKTDATEDPPADPEDDEAWVLELLNDDSDEPVQFKKIVQKPEDAAVTEAPKDVPETPASESVQVEPLEPANDEARQPVDEDELTLDLDELLAELEAERINQQLPIERDSAHKSSSATEQNGETSTGATIAPAEAKAATQPANQHAATPEAQQVSSKLSTNASLQSTIAAIEPEPLEVDWSPSPNWKKRLMWSALAVVALLLLLAQVAWLEFNRLNTIEPYRSFYAIACRHLDCVLPDLVDRRLISTSNLVVRSHPEVENALLVDVILQNNASFEQSFPSLLLTFSDLQNKPVASRRLAPDEYLGGELAGRERMPVKQPIHIGLEIADPGQEAVSYSITIVD